MNILVWLFLILALFSIIGTIPLLLMVYRSGAIMRRLRLKIVLKRHRRWVNRFLLTTLISVLFIESMIRMQYGYEGGRLLDTLTGQIHVIGDIVYAISLICMRFWLTGLTSKRWHRILFKLVLVSYSVIIATGAVLMYELMSKA